ncbi:MAG: uncharacterized protein JWN98_1775 [Abditibacteriota bacterium]|nr:uncharacterized protein [Abditibacteriota bacterium]
MAVFATIVPAKLSSGLVLPILIAADIVAVLAYRRHAVWSHLWGLFPWAALGIGTGYAYFRLTQNQSAQTQDAQMSKLIGLILITMVGVHLWRKWRAKANQEAADEVPSSPAFVASTGIFGGFTTLVANAAGPVMTLYLLSMRLPKMEFLGTGAWYFFLLNCFKVPFMANLGLVNARSLALDLPLMATAMGGALFGRKLLPYINQQLFESMALGFTVLASIKLLL